MKKFLRNKIWLVASLVGLAFALFCAKDTFATSATSLPSWTGEDITQSGAAWYYYRFTGDKKYEDDEVIYVPFDDANTNVEKTAIPAKTCKSYGGFYVLLNNGYDDGKITDTPYSAAQVSDISVSSLGSDYQKYPYAATNNIKYIDPKISDKEFDNGLKLERTISTMSDGLKEYTNLFSTSAVPDYAKTDVGALRYFCYGDIPDETIPLVNFSTVSVNNNSSSAPVVNGVSYLSNSLVVATGQEITITFHHYIAKNTSHELTGGGQVGQVGYTISDGSSGSIDVEKSADNFIMVPPAYYAYKIDKTITITATEEQTYCQSIESSGGYSLSNFELVLGGEIHSSSACVTIKPIVNMSGVVTDCNYKNDGSFRNDEFFGNTVASVGISKNNQLTDKNVTTAAAEDDTVTIFAKPGDIAQFSYALCFGAHSVVALNTGNVGFISGDNIDEDGKIRSDYEMENSFKITTNGVTDDGPTNYLFGRADAFLGDTIVVSNVDARQKDLKKSQGDTQVEIPCEEDASVCENEHHDCETAISSDNATSSDIPYFSSSEDYLAGDTMIYQGSIYEAKSDIPAGASLSWDEEEERYVFNYNLWQWVTNTSSEAPQCAWINIERSGGSFYGTDGQLPFYNDRDYYDIQKDKNEVVFASPDSKSGATRFDVTSILGSTLSQTLSYNYLAFWPSKLCNGSFCRGCGINDTDPGDCEFGMLKTIYYNIGAQSSGIYQRGWYSSPSQYKNALNYITAGYTIPSDAYNIGYGAFQDDGSKKTIDKTAKVIVPYNFDTNLSVEVGGYLDGTIYPGDIIDISARVDILPRENPLTSSVDDDGNFVPYATATPPNTKVNLIELLIPETVDIDNDNDKPYSYSDGEKIHEATLKEILNGEGDPYNKSSICSQYSSYLGDDLGECRATVVAGNASSFNELPYAEQLKRVGNADSNPAGEMGYFDTEKEVKYEENGVEKSKKINELKRVAPDAEAGYKYCVAIGINHGDSHNIPGVKLEPNQYLEKDMPNPNYAANAFSVNSNVNSNTPASWKVSKFSCRTIAKKPTYQIWNGGVYSSGNISGSVYYKSVNTKVNLNKTENDPIYSEKEKFIAPQPAYFGSWAEYFIVSRGSVAGVASASALGYTSPTKTWRTRILDANGNEVGEPKFREHQSYFADTGLNISAVNDFCALAHLTIANTSCKNGKTGEYTGSNNTIDEAYLKDFKQRIIDYYTNDNLGITDDGVINGGVHSNLGPDFKYAQQNGVDFLKVNSNYTIDEPISRKLGDKTLVIEVDGNLTISRNICLLDDGFCSNSSNSTWENDYDENGNNLSLKNRNNWLINSSDISNIPQIILIAENIEIDPEVTQIDAWLITNSRDDDYDGGYINTCSRFTNDKTGSDLCWKTLKINAPVITSALFLNRTGGAWPGYSGDVGNQAYDVLNKKMRDDIEEYTKQITGTGAVDLNNIPAPFNNLPFEQKENFKAIIEKYIASCGEVKETTMDACVKKKIVKRLKTLYPIAINPDDPNDPKRKAYENAANYYAAWDSFSGWDNNQIDDSQNDAKRASSRDLTCDGSITPAEIFDLHPLTYYWTLAESQKNNKALVTYAQEFAPRY